MKKPNAGWMFACGTLFGLSLALCLGAGVKTNAPPAAPPMEASSDTPRSQWSHLQVVAYPNGATGFFNTETGTIYVYDGLMRNCYLVRQLKVLGRPMQ